MCFHMKSLKNLTGSFKMRLEEFLTEKAKQLQPWIFDEEETMAYISYEESINPDAFNDSDDIWLENGTSYIWKVGILICYDFNKLDWISVFIGHERQPNKFQFIGNLYWEGGENDDVGRCLRRYINILNEYHSIFEDK